MKVKKEPKFSMSATRRNLFLRYNMSTNSIYTNSFSDPKGEVPKKAGGQNFSFGQPRNHGRQRATEILFS
jgi:hypothetical protein